MKRSKFLIGIVTALSLSILISGLANADTKIMRASVFSANDFENVAVNVPKMPAENCVYETPENKSFKAQTIAVRRKLKIDTDEVFRVTVFVKNAGNMPWFSGKSTCTGPHVSLGTDKPRDSASQFYAKELDGVVDTNWEGNNRIGMDQLRVDPGYTASFTFFSRSPKSADILKENLTPVVEGITWMDEAKFSFDLMVGDSGMMPADVRLRMFYANQSGSAMDIPIDGEKSFHLNLDTQKMHIKLGDYVVREFTISSGASATPTPRGEYSVILKQEVRVGGKEPHYIMPNFMMFDNRGYGFHALPSLRGRGDAFWTEAQSHIGIPVSHGCVRMLPEESQFAFDFADIGTKVHIER
ncbi:MAG: L,D-transpeptidase [Candidatus Peregrinibacteria bacterium]|nr:L,D-transpeptidase [Candidatus Peregrinibacteria bacterium]